jgi:hypothetical protein
MKNFLMLYIESLAPRDILSHKFSYGKVTQFSTDFIGRDEKYYSFNILFTNSRIVGDPNSLNDKAESVALLEGSKDTPLEIGLFTHFSRYLRRFETFEEFKSFKSVSVTSELVAYMYSTYLEELRFQILTIHIQPFKVIEVIESDSSLNVYFTVFNRVELPLRYFLGEVSVIQPRNYGKHTQSFMRFVECIGSLVGGSIIDGRSSKNSAEFF